MGKYQYILQAVNDRNLLVLFIVAAGACVGFGWPFRGFWAGLLARYHDYIGGISDRIDAGFPEKGVALQGDTGKYYRQRVEK